VAQVYPIILCGGMGSRLWPESTPNRPKAFLALTGPRSLLQETALRVAGIAGAATPIVVASAVHIDVVRAQFAEVGVPCQLVAEPGGRGSAPAIAAAALEIFDEHPQGVALVVACDHHVPDAGSFADGVRASLAAAAAGSIVTFGVKPTHPSEAYGYILPGDPLQGPVRSVTAFVEKPPPRRAEELILAGGVWNSGNFVFAVGALIDELEKREPALLAAVRRARREARREGDLLALGDAFLASPNIAIDVAVMEKTDRAAVLSIDYAWSDLGAWDSVLEAAEKDAAGNATRGRVELTDSEGCLIRADAGARVVVVGLRDIAVVVENGRILVCDLASAQKVRTAASGIEGD